MSEEFHVIADSGEDTLVFNDKDFSSNIELLDDSLRKEIEKKIGKMISLLLIVNTANFQLKKELK